MEAKKDLFDLQIPRVLLIDVDNCPDSIGRLPEILPCFDRVIAAYGGVSPRIPLSLVHVLAPAMSEGTLEMVGLPQRKNAADFALAFYAGRLAEQMPADTHFEILSEDSGLDSVIQLLVGQGFVAHRIGGTGRIPIQQIDYAQASQKYYEERLRSALHSPVRRTTLEKSIRSFYKDRREVEPDRIVQQLIRWQIVVFDEKGNATYDLTREALGFGQEAGV